MKNPDYKNYIKIPQFHNLENTLHIWAHKERKSWWPIWDFIWTICWTEDGRVLAPSDCRLLSSVLMDSLKNHMNKVHIILKYEISQNMKYITLVRVVHQHYVV